MVSSPVNGQNLKVSMLTAAHKWTQAEYMQPLLQTRFRVAKPAGGTCFMTLLAYLQYASTQCDEEPLYIFDE